MSARVENALAHRAQTLVASAQAYASHPLITQEERDAAKALAVITRRKQAERDRARLADRP